MKGRKDDAGKPPLSLLPYRSLGYVAEVFRHGVDKYGRENWRYVRPPRRYYDAALRHVAWRTPWRLC